MLVQRLNDNFFSFDPKISLVIKKPMFTSVFQVSLRLLLKYVANPHANNCMGISNFAGAKIQLFFTIPNLDESIFFVWGGVGGKIDKGMKCPVLQPPLPFLPQVGHFRGINS